MTTGLPAFFVRLHDGLSSRLRRTWFRALGADLAPDVLLKKVSIPRQWADIRLAAQVALDDHVTLIASGPPSPGKITIGERTYVNRSTIFDASASLVIGDDCMIGPGCYLTDHDHGISPGLRPADQPLIDAPTRLGNRVWLGAHVTVLKGVTIGDDAVVGAGSVVTRDVPAGARVVGIPARPLKASSTSLPS